MLDITHSGDIAILTITNPPVNALSHAVRLALFETFDTLSHEKKAKAVVLTGAGRFFVAGADITEFGKPPKAPILPDLIALIEESPLPAVAAIHGAALGGGLELALACSHRIAVEKTKFALPETQLGLIPGAGGTQRVPRLCGIENAMKMVTSTKPLSAKEALDIGLIDECVNEERLIERATEIANSLIGEARRRVGQLPKPAVDQEAIDRYRKTFIAERPGQFALSQAVESVIASTELDLDEGAKQERARFMTCMEGPERAGLIHAFFADRRAAKVPELKTGEARDVSAAGVIGGGTMGAGIAASMLLSGLSVTMIERDEEAATAGFERVKGILDGSVKRGKLAETERDALLSGKFKVGSDYALLGEADLTVEAVFEDMDVKKTVFAELDRAMKPGAILASNTSYLDINEIAGATARPEAVIGLHFFSPAHIMKLLEIVVADQTDPDVTATGFKLAKTLRKVAVRSGVCDGFIGNRILARYRQAADYLMLDGASPYEIDDAVRAFGFPMGPYQVADLAGLDIGWATRKRKAPNRDARERYVAILDQICEQGHFGRKTGRGLYRYDQGNPKGVPDDEVLAIIDAERTANAIAPRSFTSDEIVERYMAAMVNEAARVIEEKIALRPSDIDVTLLYGYGFPRFRGGPTLYADLEGPKTILERIESYADEDAFFWQPASLLRDLAASGRTFASLNDD